MRKTMNWQGFVLLLGVLLLGFLVVHTILQGQINRNQEKQTALQIELTREQASNNELTSRANEIGTMDYIVRNARENYAFISKNELRFEFDNPEALYNYTKEELYILMEELSD